MEILGKGGGPDGYFTNLARNLKFRYLGLGFLWAWIYATWLTPVVFPASSGLTTSNDISWLLSCASVAVTLFVLAVVLRDRDISSMKGSYVIAGIGTSLASIMMAIEPLFGISIPAVEIIGALATGVTSGFLWMMWGEFTGKVEQEFAELFVPWCVAVPLVVMFVCSFVSGPVAGMAICCLPAVSAWLLYLSFKDNEVIKPVPMLASEERPRFIGDFIRVGLGSTVVYMCISFAWGQMDYATMTGWGDTHLLAYILGAALAIVITTLSIVYSPRMDIFGLYRWLIPVVLFGLLFLSIDSFWTRSFSLTLITMGQYGFDIVIWIYFSRIVRKGVCSGSFSMGINRGFVQVGVFSGSFLALAVSRLLANGEISLQMVIIIISAVMTTVILMVLNRKDELERMTIIDPIGSAPSESNLVDYDAVCDQLASENSLTAREREILGYLARGRSLPYIREVLVLSKNTVDTHAKNLYRKLEVHSRQELIDLVQGESDS